MAPYNKPNLIYFLNEWQTLIKNKEYRFSGKSVHKKSHFLYFNLKPQYAPPPLLQKVTIF